MQKTIILLYLLAATTVAPITSIATAPITTIRQYQEVAEQRSALGTQISDLIEQGAAHRQVEALFAAAVVLHTQMNAFADSFPICRAEALANALEFVGMDAPTSWATGFDITNNRPMWHVTVQYRGNRHYAVVCAHTGDVAWLADVQALPQITFADGTFALHTGRFVQVGSVQMLSAATPDIAVTYASGNPAAIDIVILNYTTGAVARRTADISPGADAVFADVFDDESPHDLFAILVRARGSAGNATLWARAD